MDRGATDLPGPFGRTKRRLYARSRGGLPCGKRASQTRLLQERLRRGGARDRRRPVRGCSREAQAPEGPGEFLPDVVAEHPGAGFLRESEGAFGQGEFRGAEALSYRI